MQKLLAPASFGGEQALPSEFLSFKTVNWLNS